MAMLSSQREHTSALPCGIPHQARKASLPVHDPKGSSVITLIPYMIYCEGRRGGSDRLKQAGVPCRCKDLPLAFSECPLGTATS